MLVLSEEALPDWDVDGPRTCKYICGAIGKKNMSPIVRSARWRSENSLQEPDGGAVEHMFLSELLEVGLCRDQLDVSNLQTFELIVRRLQIREEAIRQKV